MMSTTRLSRYFLPVLRDEPKEAEIVSHRLMLRAGMVRQSSSGIYNWLPLGTRVLKRIEAIVREEQNRAGGVELLMPTLQSADLWRESGRYDDYGAEMLRITDRQGRDMLYGPTNEEAITAIVRGSFSSWRDVSKLLYHIQWKFRDEVRPRFGVMRGREFLMKDAYSFDIDMEASHRSYNRMFVAYLRTYHAMGLRPVPMRAATGPIGGDLSHEFIVLAESGESQVYCDSALLDLPIPGADIDYDGDLAPLVDDWTSRYAATDEKHDPKNFSQLVSKENQVSARGIEVGQLFYFGTKYSTPMKATIQSSDGTQVALHMGSYGIGVSRLVGAIIETSHDERGIIWPAAVAPFHAGLIQLRVDDPSTEAQSGRVATELSAAGVEVLWDDTTDSAGAKFSRMDLIGLPWQVVVGPRQAAIDEVEFRDRATGARENLSTSAAIAKIISLAA